MCVYDSSYVRGHNNQGLISRFDSTVHKREIAFFVKAIDLKNVPIFCNVSSPTIVDKLRA